MKKFSSAILSSSLLAIIAFFTWPYIYQVSILSFLKRGVDVSILDHVAPIIEQVIFTTSWLLLPWFTTGVAYLRGLRQRKQKRMLTFIIIVTGILAYALKVYFKHMEFPVRKSHFYEPQMIDFPHFSIYLLLGFLFGALVGWFVLKRKPLVKA